MTNLISKYGTFLVIPPVLFLVGVIAFNFKVTTKAEVVLVQSAPNHITAFIPTSEPVPEVLRLETPEFGLLEYAVMASGRERSHTRLSCQGSLPASDSLLKAYMVTGHKPIFRVLFDNL